MGTPGPVALLVEGAEVLFRARRGGGSGAHLEWRVGLFVAGGTLGLAGIRLEQPWLTGAAIMVLVAGALIHLVPYTRGHESRSEPDDEG